MLNSSSMKSYSTETHIFEVVTWKAGTKHFGQRTIVNGLKKQLNGQDDKD